MQEVLSLFMPLGVAVLVMLITLIFIDLFVVVIGMIVEGFRSVF